METCKMLRESTESRSVRVVGREPELLSLEEFVATGSPARTRVLVGEPGIGKSTLWEAGVELAAARGFRVLSARPTGAESELAFSALIDLLDEVDLGVLSGVAAPQRNALEIALLRREPRGVPPHPPAIASGLRSALQQLAAENPLLVAVDDVQWLDTASADALAYAARRLFEEPVRFLLARRPGSAPGLERALAVTPTDRLPLASLTFGALRVVLAQHLDASFSRRVIHWIHQAARGNPLFALELGRNVLERGPPEIGAEPPALDLAADLFRTRLAGAGSSAERALLAAALSSELSQEEITAVAGGEALEEALDTGLLTFERGRVRPTHPLLGAAARERSSVAERRALHRQLADAVPGAELRARHLALATTLPDTQLAATLAAAARSAAARGAVAASVELGEHALRLTPPGSRARGERVLTLAERLFAAGEHDRVRRLLSEELETFASGAEEARFHLLLADAHFVTAHVAESGEHLRQAVAASEGDLAQHARAVARWSRYLSVGRIERLSEAERCVLEVLPAAHEAGPEAEREALHALATVRKLRGRPVDDLCGPLAGAPGDSFDIQRSPERIAADRLALRGHVSEARTIFRHLLEVADERGERWSSMWLLLELCELELRAGEWEAASLAIAEWEPEQSLLGAPGLHRHRALLAAGRGLGEEADRSAGEGVRVSEQKGLRWNLFESLRARGIAALLASAPDRAEASLRPAWEHCEREGVDEPAEFPVAPDLVEALVELDRLDDASAVTARLRALADEQEHPWGLATAARCEALLEVAAGHAAEAAEFMTRAVESYRELGLRFDAARSLLALGRGLRRLKQWGAARRSLEGAAAAFDELGSGGWAELARAELTRVGGRRPRANGDLTPTECRVVQLAADGLANKQIARSLAISIHTVEVHLSHAYEKLGVRSRTQLPRRLSSLVSE